jgi:probable blue pigment (indigoidine) exporter
VASRSESTIVTTRSLASLIAAAACWGVGTVVSKQAVAEIPPVTLLATQLGVSVAVLGLVARWRGQALPSGREGRLLGRLGLLNPGLAYALGLIALTQMTASLAVLLWAIEPILILGLAAVVLRERPGAAFLPLSALAIAGLGLVLYDPSAAGATLGVVVMLVGIACCAVYTVATRRWLAGERDSTFGVVLAQQAHAFVFAVGLLIVAAVAGVDPVPARLTSAGVVSSVVSGLLYYALAYSFYLWGLRAVPASMAAVSFYLIPVFGVAAATAFGDRLGAIQWVGALMVILAVAAITVRTRGAPRVEAASVRA